MDIMTEQTANNQKRNQIILWVSIGFIAVAIGILIYYLTVLRYEQYTDDAYVQGNLIEITPQVPGIVSSINVDNTDLVKEGQVLVNLDPTDYQIALEKSKNELGEAVRDVVQMFLKVEELEADLAEKEALLFKAEKDYENRVPLVEVGECLRRNLNMLKRIYWRSRQAF